MKNKDNYIILNIQIGKSDIGEDITIIRQSPTYKLFQNFELDDFEFEINGENTPIKYQSNSFCDAIFYY